MTDKPHRMLTVEAISELLDVSKMTVYRLIHTGQIRAYRISRSIKVDSRDFEEFMRSVEIGAW